MVLDNKFYFKKRVGISPYCQAQKSLNFWKLQCLREKCLKLLFRKKVSVIGHEG